MKKVTELKEKECIHCTTKEEFKAILELNQKNNCESSYWYSYKENTIYFPYHKNQKGTFAYLEFAKKNNYTIHPASDFLQPTYQLTKSQIIEIAENGSLVKELFPDVFEVELEVRRWYKSEEYGLWFIEELIDHSREKSYGINKKGNWVKSGLRFKCNDYKPATPEEVETALVNEAKRRGFVDGVTILSTGINGWKSDVFEPFSGVFSYKEKLNILECNYGNGHIFENGTWAEILQTPNDVIKVIETYGTDKLLTFIEAYNGKN